MAIEQWNLPRGAKVDIGNGEIVTYLGMDGMYAKWEQDGQLKNGNFEAFEKDGDIYRPCAKENKHKQHKEDCTY